ncbi:MAG TPA: hypothetical protein VFU54_03240 [Actinomycetota bacterium]|nr:hypothetical protein [Actinomycetota bacterium]
MTTADELWALLPAVYRRRDAEAQQAGALQALVAVLGEQAEVLAEDLARLYDNWFIETCDGWVVPYIGDLVGVRTLHPVGPATAVPRAYVANSLAYRRRKGTLAVLEQLARDVTGWPAKAVELFQLLATTQYANHPRPHNLRTPDLRGADGLELLGGPFERAAHTAEVRRPPAGRYGIPNVGLFVWRLRPFLVTRVTARPVSDPADGRYRFDPVGLDTTLFNPPLPEDSITSLARERHVPGPLRRRALFDELEALRAGRPAPPLPHFGVDPVVEVFADTGAGFRQLLPEELTAADLSDPPPAVTSGWRRPAGPLVAAVDPVLGRLAFRDGLLPAGGRVEVSYTYAAAGAVGAGPYDRTPAANSETARVLARATFVRAVGQQLPPRPGLVTATLADALTQWAAQPPGTTGVIAVLDSRSYPPSGAPEPLALTVPAGSTLLLAAGTWPEADGSDTTGATPALGQLRLDDRRPHLRGPLTVTGGAGAGPAVARGRLLVDGLLLEGDVTVAAGDLGGLSLRHVTVVPGSGSLTVAGGNRDLEVTIDRCVTGPVGIPAEGPTLTVTAGIVDGGGGPALALPEGELALDAVTVLGDVACRRLDAGDCLLTGQVTVQRRQEGCVRHSYLRDDASTPRRYRCQPDLALRQASGAAAQAAVRARLTPQLTSTRFGDPGYGQLSDRSAAELLEGSSRHSDLGAFRDLMQPQREANLRAALDEYLRLGLQAGVFHVT